MMIVTNIEKIMSQMQELTELEASEILKLFGEHLRKNKMAHIIDQVFNQDDLQENIRALESELDDAENENNNLKFERDELKSKIDKINGIIN